MIEGKKVIALIPARGGSKRLPRKNVLPLNGKPLIAWSIDAANNCPYIDKVLVSTDDQEIADIALQFGAEVPELRPEHLASDTAKTESVLIYTLEKFGKGDEILVLLQPTSPLRTTQHINEALELFIEKQALSVVSVTPCEHSPLWSNTLPEDGSMGGFLRPEALNRSQDLGEFYRLNGAIYIFDARDLLEQKKIHYTAKSYAYVMDNRVSFDIDQKLDFELAEFFLLNKPN
ncbi:TPA: acylneuraminate cytidylyltransferase family protein [Vibrio parahaemolyticus]|uniref:acylneuraminate cytidylyltransferase family protein n=3 Tax=Vibrio parahaemolyticus TaxID=670 RepID=UPI00040E1852|nr:acylneuraminate cytidylyltransferase family protein [Vibrio parahaemolyticus]AYF16587.1 N-Acetylneuraminate cytidylyltransferase [Vibrio parahaemolyticus]EGR2181984.1 acylneuraminate cytidylyltransferase family protein [Vibrio parahaemolyticus]EHH1048464.1 acylneuraminate cytidylyltransferase family protein [Vibrio parahaemolyticus]ELA9865589.1 acylneuraminate cytidylyltransferase family protein [Vibrio parahaemolyticus]ELI5379678.1 acylneuraminate cytidylyltransferase family protein [Vibri